ncbi:MAG: ABC transporter substrate-binding protein [Clostridiales bacterium]|nr:ABC transporter substrate-binding protein [Clostridiales bacterium]
MKKLIAVLMLLMMACGIACAEDAQLTLTAPNGAPAVSVATLAEEKPELFSFIAADTIAAEFAKNESDFIIAPVNAGAKLFKAGKSTYRLAAVITWGNLVFASQRADFKPEDINGQTVTLFGENTINASVALYALEQKGIVPAQAEYLAGAAETQQLLLQDPDAIVLTAEPAVTAAKIKNEAVISYPVNDLLGNGSGFTQAGVFVRAETIEANAEAVNECLALIAQSAAKCTEDPDAVAKAAVALEILPNEKVAMAAIPNCGIRYIGASEVKEAIGFTVNIDPAQFGGAEPEDGFYYEAQ